jgi:hypothetical protein
MNHHTGWPSVHPQQEILQLQSHTPLSVKKHTQANQNTAPGKMLQLQHFSIDPVEITPNNRAQ